MVKFHCVEFGMGPLAVPDKIFGLTLFLDFIDRGTINQRDSAGDAQPDALWRGCILARAGNKIHTLKYSYRYFFTQAFTMASIVSSLFSMSLASAIWQRVRIRLCLSFLILKYLSPLM